jgi:hypothetical protein
LGRESADDVEQKTVVGSATRYTLAIATAANAGRFTANEERGGGVEEKVGESFSSRQISFRGIEKGPFVVECVLIAVTAAKRVA